MFLEFYKIKYFIDKVLNVVLCSSQGLKTMITNLDFF